ncbi:MAG: hypothetical protein ACI4VP_05535 [Clostridia bacterium]
MKKVIISIIAILAVVAVANTVFASSVLDDLEGLKQEGNTAIKENQNLEEIESGELENQNKNQNLNTNVANNKNENAPTTTPYTGIEDYSSAIFIVIFAVSAIYAYKKIRDYKE